MLAAQRRFPWLAPLAVAGLLQADYIVVEMANKILGADWMKEYVRVANAGGIERVLV